MKTQTGFTLCCKLQLIQNIKKKNNIEMTVQNYMERVKS